MERWGELLLGVACVLIGAIPGAYHKKTASRRWFGRTMYICSGILWFYFGLHRLHAIPF